MAGGSCLPARWSGPCVLPPKVSLRLGDCTAYPAPVSGFEIAACPCRLEMDTGGVWRGIPVSMADTSAAQVFTV